MEYSPNKMKTLLEKNGFNLKKNFGQNFIIDENIIDGIIKKSEIDQDTLVLEIGPGAGSLTYKLSEQAGNIIAYEIDKQLKPVLDTTLKDKTNIEIIYQDFLTADVKTKIKNHKKLYVVANLPYYITTPIIMKIIEDKLPVQKIVVMVQKEVGNRFKAKPGTKDYNSLSVFLDYYFDIKKIMDISKHVFLPKPNVDSIVIEMKKKPQKQVKNEQLLFKLIKDSFKQKRKTMKNNLKEYPLDQIETILKKHNFDLTTRAEQIPLEIFIEIANEIEVRM